MTENTTRLLVSIVVPVYNAETFIARTLESVRAQTLSSWELIAVDDGSKDKSAEIVRDYALRDTRIRLIQQENGGVAAARNRGYAEANPQSHYIIFLDNDDIWTPNLLEKLCHTLDQNPTCVAAHSRALFVDANERPWSLEDLNAYYQMIHTFLTERFQVVDKVVRPTPHSATTTFNHFAATNCIISPGCVLLRRSLLPAAPIFDAQAESCDDWDLYINLTRQAPFVYVPEALFWYRVHDANESHNTAKMERSTLYVQQKALRSLDNTSEQRKALQVGIFKPYRQRREERLEWMRTSLRRGKLIAALQQSWQILKIHREMHRLFR